MSAAPLLYIWDGEVFRPLPHFVARANKQFVVGLRYRLIEEEERSIESHRHQFAAIREHWQNWPEWLDLQFGSADDLRKHALIMSGWRHERRWVLSTNKDARLLAASLDEGAREYALISTSGNVVIKWTARSQRQRGEGCMNKKDFQKSKTDVLEWIEAYLEEAHKQRQSPSIAPDREKVDA
jgi:hypothetical protein